MADEYDTEEARAAGYVNGKRLSGQRRPLRNVLSQRNGWRFLGGGVAERCHAYARGFVAGWKAGRDG